MLFLTGKEHEATKLSSVYHLPELPKANSSVLSPTPTETGSTEIAPALAKASSSVIEPDDSAQQKMVFDTKIESYSIRTFHPWRRSFARGLDLSLVSILLGLVLAPFAPESEIVGVKGGGGTLSTWYYTTIWSAAVMNAIFISRFGTTIGKWLLGIRVLSEERSLLPFKKALGREIIVLLLGFGAGVFVFSLLSIGITIWFIKTKGATPWDRYALASTEFAPLSLSRLFLALPVIIGFSTAINFMLQFFYSR
jgi:uncharacterized RDD family membrane protein YckC